MKRSRPAVPLQGFEPQLLDPESSVLPLDERGIEAEVLWLPNPCKKTRLVPGEGFEPPSSPLKGDALYIELTGHIFKQCYRTELNRRRPHLQCGALPAELR
jgi:hypothetical protein